MAARRSSPEYQWIPDLLPQGKVGDFLIQSENDPSVYYVVDLMAYNAEGECTCDDYMTRIGCYRSKEVEPLHKNCKHIRRAREYVGEEFIRSMHQAKLKGELVMEHGVSKVVKHDGEKRNEHTRRQPRKE